MGMVRILQLGMLIHTVNLQWVGTHQYIMNISIILIVIKIVIRIVIRIVGIYQIQVV